MSERFVNLEIGGVPLVMYGAIATTVAVIAYATVSGGLGDSAAKAIGMQTTSISNPESPKEESPKEEAPKEESPKEEEKTEGGSSSSKKRSLKKKRKDANKKRRKTPRHK